MRAYLKAILFALAVAIVPAVAHAADTTPIRSSKAAGNGNGDIIITQPSPVQPAPTVRYGCKRIWRCDAVVCDWRRGCWGSYGYMEGPYYTVELAKRQWERHGWSTPQAVPK